MLTCGGLFDGVGLLAYGLHLAGWEHSWLCEWDPWRRSILEQRWPGIPVYDDVRAVGHGARPVTLIAGGFPCKGASTVGKLEGFGHPETVLWFEMARAIGELRPRYVLVENVANLLRLHNGEVWGTVLGGLVALGYDVVWDCIPAAAVGAPHLRDRVFAVATHADFARANTHPASGSPRAPVGERDRPIANAASVGHERSGAPWAGRNGSANGGPSVADPNAGAGRGQWDADRSTDQDGGRRLGVAWGDYEPAIRRWEAVHGPAPEPLVPRMDARSTAGVVRSRLSALGDGVQVQVGYIAGRYIAGLEEGRLAA